MTIKLTRGQRQVLELVVAGYRHQEIADQLQVRCDNVSATMSRICARLECRTSAAAIARAVMLGLVAVPPVRRAA